MSLLYEPTDAEPADDHAAGTAPPVGSDRAPARRSWLRRRWPAVVVAVAVVTAGVIGIGVRDRQPAAHRAYATDTTPVTPEQMEATYGVRFDLVALAALGGMVQLRFTVLDKDKAIGLFHDQAQSPAIAVESSGSVLRAPEGMAHKVTLLDGGSYFMLYANTGGVLRQGTKVSVLIDKVRIEHLVVQR